MSNQLCAAILLGWVVLMTAADRYDPFYDGDQLQEDSGFFQRNPRPAELSNEEFENNLIIMNLFKMYEGDLIRSRAELKEELGDLITKGPDVKKWWFSSSDDTDKSTVAPSVEPKWKIKKGRTYLCYFKLCSFRPLE